MSRISVGPKKTLAELEASVDRLTAEPGAPGQPDQEFDQKLKLNHWKYHRHLDPSWDNAEWAAKHDNTAPDSPYKGDKYFDRTGKKANEEFKKALSDLFIKYKKIDLTDPNGPQWLMSWRMYPNEQHPRWSTSGFEGCGCNCGCYAPKTWDDKS